MGLLLGSIPVGQRGPPGWGGLCVSGTSSSLARSMRNVPLWGDMPSAGRRVPTVGLASQTLTPLIADFSSVVSR